MPLKLSLKPGEKFVLNGAVVENGDRRATLVLQNKAAVLREKDIMQQAEANTPARRIYFPVMMMYLDQGRDGPYYEEFVMRMTEFMGAIRNPDVLAECVGVSRDVITDFGNGNDVMEFNANSYADWSAPLTFSGETTGFQTTGNEAWFETYFNPGLGTVTEVHVRIDIDGRNDVFYDVLLAGDVELTANDISF